jgi:hypothetical protein
MTKKVDEKLTTITYDNGAINIHSVLVVLFADVAFYCLFAARCSPAIYWEFDSVSALLSNSLYRLVQVYPCPVMCLYSVRLRRRHCVWLITMILECHPGIFSTCPHVLLLALLSTIVE